MHSFLYLRYHLEDTVTHYTAHCAIFGFNSLLRLSLGDRCGSVFENWGLNLKIHFLLLPAKSDLESSSYPRLEDDCGIVSVHI